MNELKIKLFEFLDSLYVPKSKRCIMQTLQHFIEENKFLKISKNESGKVARQMLIIKTKGKGARCSFDGFDIKLADFDTKIGKRYVYAYIYNMDSLGQFKRLDITSVKNLIII